MKIYEETYGKVVSLGWITCELEDVFFVVEPENPYDKCLSFNVRVVVAFDAEEEQIQFLNENKGCGYRPLSGASSRLRQSQIIINSKGMRRR